MSDLNDAFAESLQFEPPSTFEKIESALGSRDALIFYCGAFIGSLGFALMCVVWGRLL